MAVYSGVSIVGGGSVLYRDGGSVPSGNVCGIAERFTRFVFFRCWGENGSQYVIFSTGGT
jgi:hypothetical protein